MPSVWVEKWEMKGTSGKVYTVAKKATGDFGCTCPAWIHQTNKPRIDCQHILHKKFELRLSRPDSNLKTSDFEDITVSKRSITLND